MYKIVAIDADGTLLNNKRSIPEENKRAIVEANRGGTHIALCSGRSMVTLSGFHQALGLNPDNSSVISFNGAIVMDGYMNVVMDTRLPGEVAMNILDRVKKFNLTTTVYAEIDKMYVKLPGGDGTEYEKYYPSSLVPYEIVEDYSAAIKQDVYKVILIGENKELLPVYEYMSGLGGDAPYNMMFTSKRLLEFTDRRCTKAAGLECVCRRLGLDARRDAIAIGDSYNDLPMIELAALGVCMSNGEEGVKRAAGYVTSRDNENCGVAEVFEKFVLNQSINRD